MTDVQTSRARPQRAASSASNGGTGAFLLFGFLGSLVYFWTQADTGGERLLAILKALVWPAFVVYGALRALFG
jgi:hypothetical protein